MSLVGSMNSSGNTLNKNSLASYSKGFTLIELMIAVSILTLLLFTGAYSYSLMSERWNKELGQFSHSAKNTKHLALTQRLLAGVMPYVVVDNKLSPAFFFIGNKSSLLAVSRSGFFSESYPEIFRLTVMEKRNGKVDLIYQSKSTQEVLLKTTEQNITFAHQITLFTDLDSVNFEYFGWQHLYIKNAIDKNGQTAKWFEQFSGIDNLLMPEKFHLTLVKEGASLSLPIVLTKDSQKWLSPYYKENQ